MRGPKSDAPPPPRAWADRDPAAAARLAAAREAVAALSAEHTVPVENLLQPDLLRRLCWSPRRRSTRSRSPARCRRAVHARGRSPWCPPPRGRVRRRALTCTSARTSPRLRSALPPALSPTGERCYSSVTSTSQDQGPGSDGRRTAPHTDVPRA
ncbi:hypothetical protein [Cellulomonas soli]